MELKKDEHMTVFANYAMGSVTLGYQMSHINKGARNSVNETADQWGIAWNVNENLSVSYGEREVEFEKNSSNHITEEGEGFAVSYTMGSMKIAGNRNEVDANGGTTGSDDSMTEIAVSFAF